MYRFVKPVERYRVAPMCPCGRGNQDGKFVPFLIDGNPQEKLGHCFSCGETFKPMGNSPLRNLTYNKPVIARPELNLVNLGDVEATLKGYSKNNFALWLKVILPDQAESLLHYFSVGTCRKGGTLFWYRDINFNYRKLKRIFYKQNGHRYQLSEDTYKGSCSPLHYTNNKGFEYCLYGEFQMALYNKNTPIFLVESEKTVIISYAHYPQYLWLATGGVNGLTVNQAKVLKGRKIITLPDLHERARTVALKTKQLLESQNCKVTICDLDQTLESGEDIADLLIKC